MLQSSPNPAVFGAPVTLNADVTPSSSTRTVTFHDGVAILGVAPLSGGQAVFTTRMLNTGAHTLRAYYGRQSATSSEIVNAVARRRIPARRVQRVINEALGVMAPDDDSNLDDIVRGRRAERPQ